MDLFGRIDRSEYEALVGGLDTSLLEQKDLLRSELSFLHPVLERYLHGSLYRFAGDIGSSLKDPMTTSVFLEPIRTTAFIAAFSVKKAAWRELLPEQGRSGTLLTRRVEPVAESLDSPPISEMLGHFKVAYPGMKSLLPRARDFWVGGPLYLDFGLLEGISREQTLEKRDICNGIYLTLEPELLSPFPRLARFIDDRAMRAFRASKRLGADDRAADRVYLFAQLMPTIAAGTMLFSIRDKASRTEPVDR